MTDDRTFVVIGGGLAGAKAAEALRERGFEGRIVLFGAEPHLPYERPPLSKDYLKPGDKLEDVLVHPATGMPPRRRAAHRRPGRPSTYAETRRLAERRAAGLRQAAAGHRLSAPRRLGIPGAELAGVYSLRTTETATRSGRCWSRGRGSSFVGGGWIGLEVAAAAREPGAQVTLIEAGPAAAPGAR